MKIENPYEGRPNEDALIEQRNKYLDQEIDKLCSDKEFLERAREKYKKYNQKQKASIPFVKLLETHVWPNVLKSHKAEADDIVAELMEEYPAELIYKKITEKLSDKFEELKSE